MLDLLPRCLRRGLAAALPALLLLSGSLEAAEIRVHYNVGWGNKVAVRGSGAGLNWNAGANAAWSPGNVWVYTTPAAAGGFSFKPLFNDATWSIGANYVVPNGNAVVDIYPFFFTQSGRLQNVPGFQSQNLGGSRTLRVYLPPSYDENPAKRYPVLYMHDGQNVFDAAAAFGGVEWQVDETMNGMITQGKAREVIVVAVDNTGARMDEYTPVPDPGYGGGDGDAYLDFVELEVMPHINGQFRTLTGPQNTTIGGSSLGGLISFYAAWTRSDVFGAAICMSSSFWWNNQWMTHQVQKHQGTKPPARFYIDSGTDGSAGTFSMRDALQALGYTHGVNLFHWYDPNGAHNEASWATRFHLPVERLLAN
ncbi:MAG TPA: alpha/beta hydrolase-fold protein [Polyangiaceae bacterium]|jgi:predicted alpha/beta superfamily hydrolase|nr:alpha/beta hydrolase-fold protein [Polyangiaceae bacterium]